MKSSGFTAIVSHIKTLRKLLQVTTAVPVGDSVKNAILNKLKESGDFQNIELEEKKVNPGLMGVCLETGDKMIDASVAYDLKKQSVNRQK